ncbi:glycosyltransferase, partial [Jiangella anatolica]
MSPGLPAGFGVVLDRHTRVLDGGRVLLGGSPRRALKLSAAGVAAFQRLRASGYVRDEPTARLARRLLDAGVAHPRPPVAGGGAHPRPAVSGGVAQPGEPAAGAAAQPPRPPATDVTVIVPVRDRSEALSRCLAALAGADVIVVDDGSVDPAAVAAVADRHGARLIRRPVSGGPAAARNTGLAALAGLAPAGFGTSERTSKGAIRASEVAAGVPSGALERAEAGVVAFVDSDCVPSPGWLDRLAGHFADPAVVAVAPRIVPVVAGEA